MTATTTIVRAEPGPAAPTRPPGDGRRGPSFALLVAAAVAAGFALRVAIALTDDAASTDETAYLRSGLSLVDGDGFEREGRPELHFPPLMPLVLGLASRVFRDPHLGTVVMTVMAGTALIVPLALIGRRLAGPTAGAAAAWVAAIVPGLTTMIVNRGAGSEAEYALLLVTALWLVISSSDRQGGPRLARLGSAGLLVGLAYLTRPEGLLIAGPLGVAVVVLALRSPDDRRSRLFSAATNGVVFAAPIVACIIPYSMYLHEHTGQWQLTAKTQDVSIEAWHAVADGDRETRDSVIYALDETGLGFGAGRSSLVALARDDPSGYLGIVETNVRQLLRTAGTPESGQILAWMLLPLPILLLAAFGVWRHRRSRVALLILAVAALPVATALAFFVQPRYLVVTVALVTVFVGAAVAAVSSRWRRPLMAAVMALLALSYVQGFRGDAGWWHPSDHSDQRLAGEWLEANTEADDRIMTRSMVVEFYAERTTIAIPYADLDQILRFARHYGAQYLVVDWYSVERLRPQLQPLYDSDEVAGLRLVQQVEAEGRTTRIFAFDPAPPTATDEAPSLVFVGDGAS